MNYYFTFSLLNLFSLFISDDNVEDEMDGYNKSSDLFFADLDGNDEDDLGGENNDWIFEI